MAEESQRNKLSKVCALQVLRCEYSANNIPRLAKAERGICFIRQYFLVLVYSLEALCQVLACQHALVQLNP